MLSLREQNTRAREVSTSTGIPVQNLAVGQDGSVRAYLLNLRLDGFRMVVIEEWVEIDPDTFQDLSGE